MNTAVADMTADWIIHVRNPDDFKRSSSKCIWGFKQVTSGGAAFTTTSKPGDRLWLKRAGGIIFAVATFRCIRRRELGPLIPVTLTDKDLGWAGGSEYDMEIHYYDLFILLRDNIVVEDTISTVIKPYSEECGINLPGEYPHIVQYAPAQFDHIVPLSPQPQSPIAGGCNARKLRDPYVQGVGGLTLYKEKRCGKRLLSGSTLCSDCHQKEAKYNATGDPATGKSKHHVTWHGVMSEPPPDWSHVEGTQWHRDNESDI